MEGIDAMSLFNSKPPKPSGKPDQPQISEDLMKAFAPVINITKSHVIFDTFELNQDLDNLGQVQSQLTSATSTVLELPSTKENAVYIWANFEGEFINAGSKLTFKFTQKFKVNRSWKEPEDIDDNLKKYLYADIFNCFVTMFNVAFPDDRLIVAKTPTGVEIRSALVQD